MKGGFLSLVRFLEVRIAIFATFCISNLICVYNKLKVCSKMSKASKSVSNANKVDLAKAQQKLYTVKLMRANLVSKIMRKGDPSALGFSEKVNPATKAEHEDMSLTARAKRVSTWLKLHDREYWNEHFGEKSLTRIPAVKKGGASGSGSTRNPAMRSSGKEVVAVKEPCSVNYWVSSPSDSKKEFFVPDPAKAEASASKVCSIAKVDFANCVGPLRAGDQLLSLMVEVDILGGSVADKGRVSALPDTDDIDVGRFLGGKIGCTNLVAGVNRISIFPKKGKNVITINDLLEKDVICVYRIDETCKVFIRKWANYRSVVPDAAPASVGTSASLFI